MYLWLESLKNYELQVLLFITLNGWICNEIYNDICNENCNEQ